MRIFQCFSIKNSIIISVHGGEQIVFNLLCNWAKKFHKNVNLKVWNDQYPIISISHNPNNQTSNKNPKSQTNHLNRTQQFFENPHFTPPPHKNILESKTKIKKPPPTLKKKNEKGRPL